MPDDTLHILLVEDDQTLAEITAFRLELLGYRVAMSRSVDETHQRLADELPDVIILDLAIAGGEGIELLNRLSNDQRTGHVPVMVFSTSADLEDVQRAYNAGAAEYLVTPYDPANLEQKIERLGALHAAD